MKTTLCPMNPSIKCLNFFRDFGRNNTSIPRNLLLFFMCPSSYFLLFTAFDQDHISNHLVKGDYPHKWALFNR